MSNPSVPAHLSQFSKELAELLRKNNFRQLSTWAPIGLDVRQSIRKAISVGIIVIIVCLTLGIFNLYFFVSSFGIGNQMDVAANADYSRSSVGYARNSKARVAGRRATRILCWFPRQQF